ncbi:MAG: phosphoglucosamine mutase [Candidatus Puniceispirillum sp.]|nr:phosphoglucosamine mutase [Candidatus Pelagibacter sp.]MBA4283650.1 phosphoglucosamine mutase [Candidatus Puniceispirillum sp.]
MMKKYFGTDGIRGRANKWPMTPSEIVNIAVSTSKYFLDTELHQHHSNRLTVVIGKDTRLSGYMVESALVAGYVSMGIDVILLGPVPTPAVAMLTRSLRADFGVMISASHNPYMDNGIKIFKSDGCKMSYDQQTQIEKLLSEDIDLPDAQYCGKAKRLDDAVGRYIEYAKATFPRGLRLDGLKIVVDCAHGAAYKVAPRLLWELGAEVIALGVDPQGNNINDQCGATYPQGLQKAVLEHQAHIGIALDGDADRLILVDEKGNIVDGDQILAAIAYKWHARGLLRGQGIVGTTMSNLGLERFLESLGLKLYRSAVGDSHVFAMMQAKGCNIGGEQSGHVILSDYSTTGDGVISALQILTLMQDKNVSCSELTSVFSPVSQKLQNIPLAEPLDEADPVLVHAIERARERLGKSGRLLVRSSGTEPLIRVMVQGDDELLTTSTLHELSDIIEKMQLKKKVS